MSKTKALVSASVATLQRRVGAQAPRIAVLLGSGWAPFADRVREAKDVRYAELPAFPPLSVEGHREIVRCGRIGDTRVVVLGGRRHAYETGTADAMAGAIRSLAAWGVKALVQTNAAGSLDPAIGPGDLMLVADHINFPQRSPLFGELDDRRFVDMSDAYDPALRAQARAAAQRLGTPLHEGIYAWAMGPQFETPAEIRMFRQLGAQVLGMSTVAETILARHAGLRVLALSLVTNMAAGLGHGVLDHANTLAAANAAGSRALALLAAVVQALEL
jgi:purine-nucleoside phosphorylase